MGIQRQTSILQNNGTDMIIQKASHIVGRGLVGQFRVLAFGPAWL
jgi:hypothetical protein